MSVREEIYRRYLDFSNYVRGGTIEAHWMADGNAFWYAADGPENTVIWKVDPASNARFRLFDTKRLRSALREELNHDAPYAGVPFSTFRFIDAEESVARFFVEGEQFELQLNTYEIDRIPMEQGSSGPQAAKAGRSYLPVGHEVPSPNGRWFVGYKDHNLYLRSAIDSTLTWLTADGVEDFDWASWSRYPPKWSPDSQKLAVTKTDWRKVPKLPIVNWLEPTPGLDWMYERRPGGSLEQATAIVIDIPSGRKVQLAVGRETDQRFYIHSWLPDSSTLLLLQYSRNCKNLQLLAADATTGESHVVLTETAETSVRSVFLRQRLLTLLDSGSQFIWISERGGWRHLYLYGLDGTMVRQLTQGAFHVNEVVSVDESSGWVYVMASGNTTRPFDTHLWRVGLDGSRFTQLTRATGQHNVEFAPSKECYLDTHSSSNRPSVVELRKSDGTLLQTLAKADIKALTEMGWKAPEEFTVKAADGETDIHGVLYKPYDFDREKAYPVIEIVHEGNVVSRSFVPNYWGSIAQALAQLGFVTFSVDVRGTSGHGKAEFDEFAYGRYASSAQMDDHLGALRQLAKSRKFMDLSRVGVFGHSNGGRMAIRAMLLEPDVYHAGVATAPVGEFKDHRSALECFMDLPENNPEGYERSSTLRLVDNLKGDLLIIQGTSDRGSPFHHTMKLMDALVKADKTFDLVVIPGGDHGPTVARDYWFGAVARHFEKHLQP